MTRKKLTVMTSILCVAIAALGAGDASSPAPPADLEHLQDLVNDESKLVDAVRAFDKLNTGLAELDLKQARELASKGQADPAKGKQEDARKRFGLVKKAYEFAIQQYPNNARLQTYYGELLYDRYGDVAAAIKAWELATMLDHKLSIPWNDLGIHYCHYGDYRLGLKSYDKAIKLEPKNPDYLFNLAQTYLINYLDVEAIRKWDRPKTYREAMKLSKKARRFAPGDFDLAQDYAVNFFAAENFGVVADWVEAANAWQQTRRLARNDAERFYTWLNEGRVWLRVPGKEKAAACLQESLKILPDDPVAKQILANIDKIDVSDNVETK